MRTQPAQIIAKPVCIKKTRIAAKIRKKVLTEFVILSTVAKGLSKVSEIQSMSSFVVGSAPMLARHARNGLLPPSDMIILLLLLLLLNVT